MNDSTTVTSIPNINLSKRLLQQRQILQQMDVDCWVAAACQTQMLDEANLHHLSDGSVAAQLKIQRQSLTSQQDKANPIDSVNTTHSTYSTTEAITTDIAYFDDSNVNLTVDKLDGKAIADTVTNASDDNVNDDVVNSQVDSLEVDSYEVDGHVVGSEQKQELSFKLQGIGFLNWVLLVDVAQLTVVEQQLWHNISQALHGTCEGLSFPICNGMQTLAVAQASVAGFICRVKQSSQCQIKPAVASHSHTNIDEATKPQHLTDSPVENSIFCAALTQLPIALDSSQHIQVMQLPTLAKMLANPQQKREFWQLLSQS